MTLFNKKTIRKLLLGTACAVALTFAHSAYAAEAKPLNDLEIAHSAYTADVIDINYAKVALQKTTNPEIKTFANLMIQDHSAVNEGASALLKKLGVEAKDNDFSKALNKGADAKLAEYAKLSGKSFDLAYAENELAYHQTVNKTVEGWIPTIQNAELKTFMENALVTFKVHEGHAANMVAQLKASK